MAMRKFKGLRSVFVPAVLLAFICLFFPERESAAFIADISSVLSLPPDAIQTSYKPDPAEYLSFAVKMKGLGNLEESKRSLGEVRSLFPGTAWEKRANLLLGLMALDDGAPGAITLLEDSAGIEAIDDYILFFQAEALFKNGRFIEASGAYDFIISSYPATALKERAD